MSYVSLLKNIPDFLSQPTGIAAIASVGIHGAIAFFMPLMPMESSKPKQQSTAPKTVGLLELNQSLQNRLPQPTTPQIPAKLPIPPQQPQISLLPQVPMPSLTAQMAPVPPLPPISSQVTLPPLPKSPSNLSVSSLPKGQSLRILPIRPSLSTTNSIALGKTTVERSLPSFNSQVKLGASNTLAPSNLSPIQREVKLGASKPMPPSNLPELEAARMPTDLPSTPSPMPIAAAPPDDVTKVTQPQNQQLVAPVGETPQAGDTLALAEAGITPSQGSSITPELPSTTTQQVVAKNTTFGEQYNAVKRQYPNIETKLPISETVASKVGQPGSVEGALVVDSEGKVESIDFLNNKISSDQRAAAREYFREYFQKNPPQATGKPKYYPFSLSFRSNSSDIPVVVKEPSPSSRTEKTPRSGASQRSVVIPRLPSTPVNPQELETAPTSLTQKLRTSLNGTQTSVQQTANRSSVEPISNPTQLRVRRELEPIPQVEPTNKPSTQLQVRRLEPTPQVELTSKPSTQLQVRRLEPKPQVEPTSKPSTELRVRPSSEPKPQVEATSKPLAQLRERKNQSAAALQQEQQPTEKPSSESEVSSNQTPSPSGKQKLLRQLRELREQRQTSN